MANCGYSVCKVHSLGVKMGQCVWIGINQQVKLQTVGATAIGRMIK